MARSYLAGSLQHLARHVPGAQGAVWHGEAALLRLFWAACGRLTPERASGLGAGLLRRIGPALRQNTKIRRNYATAFPDWDAARLERTVAASWQNLGRVLAEYPHLGTICGPDWRHYIEIDARIDLAPFIDGRQQAILVSGHFGNWELSAAGAALVGVPLSVIYSRQHNRVIDRALQAWRVPLGCRFIEKDEPVHALVGEVRAGRCIGILMDQRYDTGDSVMFFGHSAPVPIAPASLALRLDLPFIPIRMQRLEGCRFRLTVEEPILPDRSLGRVREVARDMTARLYQRFEAWITEQPGQWLCSKRRWPDLRRAKWQDKLARNSRLVRGADATPPP